MSFATAASNVPFSNGTEGDAWMSAWCEHCTYDHGLHNGNGVEPMCPIIGSSMFDRPFQWPEAWLPEPDDGKFFLPSRLVCLHFEACEPCGGDPGADERAVRIAEVKAYWESNR